jgi:hypothetical protein
MCCCLLHMTVLSSSITYERNIITQTSDNRVSEKSEATSALTTYHSSRHHFIFHLPPPLHLVRLCL